MRLPAMIASCALAASLALAQQPVTRAAGPSAQNLKTFASSADVAALIAKAKSERKDNQALVAEPILQFAPYSASLEYRAIAGTAAVHVQSAELIYVIQGSGSFVTGGRLVNQTGGGANLSGTAIEGGQSQQIAKGDFLVVPENTPHQVTAVDETLVLMTIKMPRGTAQ